MRSRSDRALELLLVVVAVNAFGGGLYAMLGAPGIPVTWLSGSPFADYFWPGVILFVAVGGSATCGAIALHSRRSWASVAAASAGVVLLLWIIVQLTIVGYVSWLQPAMAMTAVVVLFLAWRHVRHDGLHCP